MKKIIAALALLGLVGCLPQIPEIPEVEIPEVEVPDVKLPSTLTTPPSVSAPNSFKSMCIAGFVEVQPSVGTIDIYANTEFSPQIQSISGVRSATVSELELDPC